MRLSFYTFWAAAAGISQLVAAGPLQARDLANSEFNSILARSVSQPDDGLDDIKKEFKKFMAHEKSQGEVAESKDKDKIESSERDANQIGTTAEDDASFSPFANDANWPPKQCAKPRIRREWHGLTKSQKLNVVNAISCLMRMPPSGKFSASRNKYEDLTALHQRETDNIHRNATFLHWHRYFLWTFEKQLTEHCGLQKDLGFPWFDEVKWAGKFSQSDVFSNEWFGPIAYPRGGCVDTGRFARITLNIGPGDKNEFGPHCLMRQGNGTTTGKITKFSVDQCNSMSQFHRMADCHEGQSHAFGHNGVGLVMMDIYASVGDPFFFLHHGFVDRNYRIWQNRDKRRVQANQYGIDGLADIKNNVKFTPTTKLKLGGIEPDIEARWLLDTTAEKLCYRYDY